MALLIIGGPSALLFKCTGLDFPHGSLFQAGLFFIIANALIGAVLFFVMGMLSQPNKPANEKGDGEK
jgi:hypothetical protein